MNRYDHKRLLLLLKIVCIACIITFIVWRNRYLVEHFVKFLWIDAYRSCVHRKRNYDLEEQSSPLYVTKMIHGRFGNWLFGYASLLGIAKANGYIPYILKEHPLTNYFKLTKTRVEPAECLFTIHDTLPCTYTHEMMNLPTGNVSIDGYIQSWKYFRFIEKELRQEFTLPPFMARHARELFMEHVGNFFKEGRLVISIHVRRGDVLKPEAKSLGFCNAPKEYFDNAMSYMLNLFPYSVFLVTSDDLPWCTDNIVPPLLNDVLGAEGKSRLEKINPKVNMDVLNQRVPIVFSRTYSDWEDFTLLSQCNHSIISVGTFGWWGAWFAGGVTTYYDGFPLPGTKIDYEMNKEDFYPPKWIALSNANYPRSWSCNYCFGLVLCFSLLQFNLFHRW